MRFTAVFTLVASSVFLGCEHQPFASPKVGTVASDDPAETSRQQGQPAATPPLTRTINDVAAMKAALLKHLPAGTPLARAQAFMAREGFHTKMIKNGSWSEGGKDHDGLDFLYCDREDPSAAWVSRSWQVAVVIRDGAVSDVLVSAVLTGP
jgi:hypothetical protein